MSNYLAEMLENMTPYAEETDRLAAQWEREGVHPVLIKARRMVRSTRAISACGRMSAEGISFDEAIKKEEEWEKSFLAQGGGA